MTKGETGEESLLRSWSDKFLELSRDRPDGLQSDLHL